ncbi:hypothetical protein [Paracoccus aerius]|nr:hypothetical protein [Paracoccus aerius]
MTKLPPPHRKAPPDLPPRLKELARQLAEALREKHRKVAAGKP